MDNFEKLKSYIENRISKERCSIDLKSAKRILIHKLAVIDTLDDVLMMMREYEKAEQSFVKGDV